jgi:hypothetical protein
MPTRYLTRWSVSTDAAEAQRFAKAEASSLEANPGVELLHAGTGWAYWSDQRVTTNAGLTPEQRQARSLSTAAAELIGEAWHSVPAAEVPGGYGALADVAELLGTELLEQGPAEPPYDPPQLIRRDVVLRSGEPRSWWVVLRSSTEGHGVQVFDQEQLAREAFLAR